VLAELTVAAGVLLTAAAAALLVWARRLRKTVRRADWLLTRASLAVAEARRASITVGGSQLVDHLLGGVARNREADPDASG
jgi:hypothetical protein